MQKEFRERLKRLDSKTGKLKVIYWVGAGIDKVLPTSLPLGNELTDFLLSEATLPQILDNMENQIGREKSLNELYGWPRLESVIECYQKLEESMLAKEVSHPFLNGFSSFWEVPPNWIHYALAIMMKKGANIVTTNYDQCIAKAYKTLYPETSLHLKPFGKEKNGYYCFECDNEKEKTGKIYYIHGIAADIDTLGATITKLKGGLDKEFSARVRDWLEREYCFVFLGYGGGASLDVNPFFKSLKGYKNTCGIYVDYAENFHGTVEPSQWGENMITLLNCFDEKIVYRGLIEDVLFRTREINENVKKCAQKEWQKEFFDKAISLDEEMRMAISVQLCFSLGIDVTKILPSRWWQSFSKLTNMQEWYISYYGLSVGKQMGDNRIIELFKPKKMERILEKSNYLAAHHKYREAAEIFGTPFDIYEQLQSILKRNGEKVGWNISTAVNRWTNYILIDIIYKPWFILKNIERNKENIEYLIKTLEVIINCKDRLLEQAQLYTAIRACELLKKMYKSYSVVLCQDLVQVKMRSSVC